jgi:hypothetical protein
VTNLNLAIGFTLTFFAILLVLAWLKRRYQFTIEPTWLAVGLLPVVIWLLFSDRLSGFTGFGVEVRLHTAANEQLSLSPDSTISVKKIPIQEKGGESMIPDFRKQGIAALDFVLGSDRYDNQVTKDYLEQVPSIKHVIFTDAAHRFIAIAPASSLHSSMEYLRDFKFAQTVADGELPEIAGLQQNFIEEGESRQEALGKMSNTNELPVLNENREFVGLVSRDAIIANLLLESIREK